MQEVHPNSGAVFCPSCLTTYDVSGNVTDVYSNPLIYIDPYGLWALGDQLPQGFVDFSAGLGDALLLGQGQRLRDLTGVDGGVDKCSDAYDYGSYAALAAGGGRLAYAGPKGGSLLASSGAQASGFRQGLKAFFRGGLGRNWRPPNLAGNTDAQLRASAGKTNFGINAYGAGVTAAVDYLFQSYPQIYPQE